MARYETTRLIRELEAKMKEPAHIPIIAVTANALSAERNACFRAGMDAYFSKPLQPDRLKAALKRWFAFSDDMDPRSTSGGKANRAVVPMDFKRLHLVAETEAEKARLLALFFRLTMELIGSMEHARRDEAFTQWKNAAHSLKGSAANFGMKNLEQLCLKAEKAASFTYDQRSELVLHIKGEVEHIKDYLKQTHPSLLN